MSRARAFNLRRSLLNPQVLVALVAVLGAFLYWQRSTQVRPQPVVNEPVQQLIPLEQTEREIELVLIDDRGFESPSIRRETVPQEDTFFYAELMRLLRTELVDRDFWPADLAAPSVFVTPQALVLDFEHQQSSVVTAQEEQQLLYLIAETLARNGAGNVQILINHEPSLTFLGHVRLDSSLE